jgi:hypothetical protein
VTKEESKAQQWQSILSKVWEQYLQLREIPTPNRRPRNCLFPSPWRGRNVDILVVGMSPNNNAQIGYGDSKESATRFAQEFEFVRPMIWHELNQAFVNERRQIDSKLYYDTYYFPLLKLIRLVNPRFGVWTHLRENQSFPLVEFTDFLHSATEPGRKDFHQVVNLCDPKRDPVWLKCVEILRQEIELYKPHAVLCNGRVASDAFHFIFTDYLMGFNPPVSHFCYSPKLGCSAHFIEFYNEERMDGFSQRRVASELRDRMATKT